MDWEQYLREMRNLVASGMDFHEAHKEICQKHEELSWKTESMFYIKWQYLEATKNKIN